MVLNHSFSLLITAAVVKASVIFRIQIQSSHIGNDSITFKNVLKMGVKLFWNLPLHKLYNRGRYEQSQIKQRQAPWPGRHNHLRLNTVNRTERGLIRGSQETGGLKQALVVTS